MKGSKEVDSIDKVWTPILLSEEFPSLNIVLRSTLSIFHSTASVEQLTQLEIFWVIDLIVLTEPNIEAKKILKSAVQEAHSVCCFDYKITKDHHANWTKARQALMNKDVEVESDDSDEEIDIDTSSRRLKKKVKNKKPVEKEKGKKKSENCKEKIEKVMKDEVKKKEAIVQKKQAIVKKEAVDKSKGEDKNKKLFDSQQPKISPLLLV